MEKLIYLSYDKIEQIADTVISDFRDKFPEYADTSQFRIPNPTAIDQFAEEYLGLDIKFAHLSSDGNFCGLTAYWEATAANASNRSIS